MTSSILRSQSLRNQNTLMDIGHSGQERKVILVICFTDRWAILRLSALSYAAFQRSYNFECVNIKKYDFSTFKAVCIF